jgi:hypothetical protein
MSNFAFAKIHEFETTHLKSLAGTGVASISSEESAFLNPAGLAFSPNGDAYIQRDLLQFKNAKGDIVQKPKNLGIVLADANPSLSGSLSYLQQEEGTVKRKRWGLTLSAPLNTSSAFGVSVRKSDDRNSTYNSKVDYYQTVFGVTHALDSQTSLGIVAYDAFNSKADETKALVGIQHVFVNYITLSADLGGNYKADEISDTLLYRGGVQIRVLDDFYLRFGAFKDKEREEKGNGYGLGWVTPRFNVEVAMKNTKQDANASIGREQTKLREVSMALALKF